MKSRKRHNGSRLRGNFIHHSSRSAASYLPFTSLYEEVKFTELNEAVSRAMLLLDTEQ